MARSLGRLTLDLVARTAEFNRNMQGASRTVSTETVRIEDAATRASNAVKGLMATAGVGLSVTGIIQAADSYTEMNNKLKLVTSSEKELQKALDDTFKIAQQTSSGWSSVNDVYTRYQKISDRLGLSQAEVARITETTAKAVAMSGASAEEAQRALTQFAQGLSLNVLKGQDLNSVMQQTPGLTDAVAKGLGTTSDKLKQMGADGILTAEMVIKGLQNVASSVDEDFAKTATTVSDSFNNIKNEFTKMIGETDKVTGASTAAVEAIKYTAENLDVLAIAGGVVAAIYSGRLVNSFVAARMEAVRFSIQQRKDIADQKARNMELLGVQALQQKQTASLAAQELRMSQLALVNAKNKDQQALATQRLASAEVAYNIALRNSNAATAAYIAAQNAATTATSRLAMVKSTLLGLTGGWVGLGVILAMVGGGYLLLRDNAQKTTASLDIQGEKVDDLIEKYKTLNTLQRDNEMNALSDQVEDLSSKYAAASSDLGAFISGLPISDANIESYKKLEKQFRKGKIEADDFYSSVKAGNILNDNQLEKLRALIQNFDSNKIAINKAKEAQTALSKEVANAANQQDKLNKKMTDAEKATKTAAEAYKKYLESFNSDKRVAVFENTLLKKYGEQYTQEYRKLMLDWAKTYNFDRLQMESPVAREDWAKRDKLFRMQQESAKIQDGINEKEKQRLDLVKAQGEALKINTRVAQNAANYNFAALEKKYNLPANMLAAIHAIETGNSGRTNQVNPETGATGGFQFLKSTGDQYGVKDRMNMSQSAEGAAKYLSYLLKKFNGDLEKAVRAYHAGEGNVEQWKNIGPYNNDYWKKYKGYTAGMSGIQFSPEFTTEDYIKLVDDMVKHAEELAKAQKEVRIEYASDIVKIETNLKDEIEKIEALGFGQDEQEELIHKARQRADAEIDQVKQTQEEKLSVYRDFVKTEEEILNDGFNAKQRALKRDLTLSLGEYVEASSLLERQRNLEITKLRISRQDQINEHKKALSEIRRDADDYILQQTNPAAYNKRILGREFADKNKQVDIGYQNLNDSIMLIADEENRNAQLLAAHEQYLQAKQSLSDEYALKDDELRKQQIASQLQSYGSLFGSMSNLAKVYSDETSKTYKLLYASQKAFTLTSVLLSSADAMGKAWASAPFPYNMLAVGQTAVETGVLQAMVEAVTPTGFSEGGYTGHGGKYEQAGIVHRGEVVWSQDDIKRWGGVDKVEAMRKGIPGYSDGGIVGAITTKSNVADNNSQIFSKQKPMQPVVNVHTLPGTTADVSTNIDGSLDIRIRQIAGEVAEQTVTGQLQRPNSPISKSFQQNTNAGRRR